MPRRFVPIYLESWARRDMLGKIRSVGVFGEARHDDVDFAEVRGQEHAKRALTLAAALEGKSAEAFSAATPAGPSVPVRLPPSRPSRRIIT